jgi:hypothetical protein
LAATDEHIAGRAFPLRQTGVKRMANVVKLERGGVGPTALARLKEELAALPRAKVLQVNVDVDRAVSTVSRALPRVRAIRAQIVRELPAFDLTNIDKLSLFAEALAEADLLLKVVVPKGDQRHALVPEARRLRTLLSAVATALDCRGLLRATALQRLKGANGYINLSHDLQLLASTLRATWSKVEKSCPVPFADLDRAAQLTVALRGSAAAEAAVSSLVEAKDLRCRAFTLLVLAYDDVRRAATYLRAHEGDAKSIAPCLYPGRPRKRSPRAKKAP